VAEVDVQKPCFVFHQLRPYQNARLGEAYDLYMACNNESARGHLCHQIRYYFLQSQDVKACKCYSELFGNELAYFLAQYDVYLKFRNLHEDKQRIEQAARANAAHVISTAAHLTSSAKRMRSSINKAAKNDEFTCNDCSESGRSYSSDCEECYYNKHIDNYDA
jgi:hypothetical protein